MLGKIEGRRRGRQMVGWHHQLDGHEFEQALGDGEGQGGLACYSLRSYKESDMTEPQLNNNKMGCSMPGFLELHYLLEFAETHVH